MFGFIFKAYDIREGERTITLLMALYHFLILITLYLLKPARDSLFLVKLGADQLPWVFILIAIVGVPVTAIYARASRKVSLRSLINGTTGVLIINLLILRWLMGFGGSWVFYLFYVWVSIYGILTVSQFWLLANAVYNASQAKRLFVLLGLGGISGAILGGGLTSVLTSTFGLSTSDLLFACMGILALTVSLVNLIWVKRPREFVDETTTKKDDLGMNRPLGMVLKTICRSKYLMIIVGIIALTTMCSSLIDFQFKTVVAATYLGEAELTAFLGRFYGVLSVVSVLLQLLLTHRLLKRYGVGGVILILPLGLLLGSIGMFLIPGLALAIVVRGLEGSLSYSADKTGRELLYVPVPLEVKKRTKVFIDMFVDRWFQGIAGVLLLLFTMVAHLSVSQISFVVGTLTAAWLCLVILARREYTKALSRLLQTREIDLKDIRIDITEAATVKTLVEALDSSNDREVVYALNMLSAVKDDRVFDAVAGLLDRRSAEVRLKAFSVLKRYPEKLSVDSLERLLADSDPSIRREAVGLLAAIENDEGHRVGLAGYLRHEDLRIRIAALNCAVECGSDEERALIDRDMILDLMDYPGEERSLVRASIARAIGELKYEELYYCIRRLLEDPSAPVVKAAIQSAGESGSEEFIDPLLGKLRESHCRPSAIAALASYGPGLLDRLRTSLLDETTDLRIRTNIPRVISRIPDQAAIDTLLGVLPEVAPIHRYPVVRALNKLRDRFEQLRFPESLLTTSLIDESRHYYETYQMLYRNGQAVKSPAVELLTRTLQEKLDQNLERIFRLLGLCYATKDIVNAYRGIIGDNPIQRGSAIELLDNLLEGERKRHLFPIVDDIPPETTIREGKTLFGLAFDTRQTALQHLIEGDDGWLRACAIYASGEALTPMLREACERALQDPDPVVRETSRLVVGN